MRCSLVVRSLLNRAVSIFDVFDTKGPVGVLLATCDTVRDTTVSLVIHGEVHDDDDDVYSIPARD